MAVFPHMTKGYMSWGSIRSGLLVVGVAILCAVSLYRVSLAASWEWDFADSADFVFDGGLVTFSGGKAQLKEASNWFDSSWTRRKTVALDNTANASTLSEYQVQVTVSYDSDMQADFDDVRFTDSDGVTPLSYYLESKTDSVSATFWVNVPTITSSATTTIYLYYGNSGASSISSGVSVFDFFDDFGDGSFDHDKWKYVTFERGDANLCTESSGVLHCSITTATQASASAIYSIKDELGDDFDTHVDWTSFNSAAGDYSSAEFWCDADANNRVWVRVDKNALGQMYYSSNTVQGGVTGSYQFYGPVVQSSGKLRIVRSGGTSITTYRWDGSSYQSLKTVSGFTTENMRCIVRSRSWGTYPDNVNAYWDNFVTEGDAAHSDDFNDNTVDTSKWFMRHPGQGQLPFETSQQMYTNAGTSISSESMSTAINRISSVDGDFEATIDFSNFTAPAQNTAYVRIYFWVDDDDSAFVSLRKNSTNSAFNSQIMVGGSTVENQTSSATTTTSGRLKIQRTGSTLTTYYWTGSSWTQLATYGSFTTDNAEIDIGIMSWDGFPDNVSADIDNVTVRKYSSSGPSVTVGSEQTRYPATQPSVTLSVDNVLLFAGLTGFSETATKNGGEIRYQLSNDAGESWYWYSLGWATTTATYSESNTATEIQSALASFPVGSGNFLFRAYLSSDGSQLVELDTIALTYSNAGVTIVESGGSTSVTEGGATDSYTIVLDDQPSDTVTVTITPSDMTTGVSLSTSTVTFTTTSWDTPVTVTVTAIDDDAFEGPATTTLSYGVSSNDVSYDDVVRADTHVSVTDNDSFVISNVSVVETDDGAHFSWDTNALSSTYVEYGLSSEYEESTIEKDTAPRTLSHEETLVDLISCSSFFYRLASNDSVGNQATSTGTFRTMGCTGDADVEDEVASDGIVDNATGELMSIGSGTEELSLEVPSSYTETCEAYFQIKKLNTADVLGETGLPDYYDEGLRTYDLGALCDPQTALHGFGAPLVVTMTYGDDEVSLLDESTLVIRRWDGAWNELSNCSIDTLANSVSCETDHFSVFGIFGQAPEEPEPEPEPESSPESSGGSSGSCRRETLNDAPTFHAALPQSNGKVLLSFARPVGAINRYIVEYEGGGERGEVTVADIFSKTYLLGGLSSDTRYSIKLRAANRCAVGPWSRTLSVSTMPRIASNILTVTSFEIIPVEPESASRSVASSTASSTTPIPSPKHTVRVNVLTEDQKPVVGATVTLHSRVRQATTDANGFARFDDIEPGAHTLTVAYENFVGEQAIFLDSDSKEIIVRITVRQEHIAIASALYGFVSAVVIVIIAYSVWRMYVRRRRIIGIAPRRETRV